MGRENGWVDIKCNLLFFFLSVFDLEVMVFHSRLIYGGSKRMQVIPVVDIKYPPALCLLYAIRQQQKNKEKKEGRPLTPIKVKSRAAKLRAFL